MNAIMMAGTIFLTASLAAGAAPLRGGMTPPPGEGDPLWSVADDYAAGMRAGNAAAVAAVFAEDAVEMPAGVSPIRGKAAIESYYRELFRSCRFATFTLSHTDSRVAGDIGFLVGTSVLSVLAISPSSGQPPANEESGKYMVVLKRSGGSWKVAAYAIYNADRPAATGPGH
jgi:uncharacterized protein (TIGR02246 family)